MAKKATKQRKRDKVTKESYLIHGMARTKKWDYSHHVVPPLSASVTYRLESVERGNQGFEQFSKLHSQALRKTPTYIYDRLDEIAQLLSRMRLYWSRRRSS